MSMVAATYCVSCNRRTATTTCGQLCACSLCAECRQSLDDYRATDREVGSHEGHKIVERPTLTRAEVPRSCTTCGVEIEPRVRDA